jgi:2-hydroxychromene-2-carboxylate isomerase
MKQVEFLYDFSSPNCYVAYHKLREMSMKWKFELCLVPLFLGGLFKMTGDAPVPRGSNEYGYMVKNLERISRTIGIEFNFPHSTFPINSVRALRGSYFAESKGRVHDYVSGVFREYWVEGADISDPINLGRILESLGLDRDQFLEFIERDETKLRLRNDTNSAYERGVFGAPTYFVDGEMYWGTPEVLWYLGERLARS